VAANANVAAPIDASVGANVLSVGSTAQALSDQGALIDQGITGEAVAHAPQDSSIGQSGDPVGADPVATDPAATDPAVAAGGTGVGAVPTDPAGALSGPLLNVDVNLAADLNLAAPIDGAVAANADVAAPIDASVAANVGSVDSVATAISQQEAIITQHVDANANATADQTSDITQ
jgi:hypothetical protein